MRIFKIIYDVLLENYFSAVSECGDAEGPGGGAGGLQERRRQGFRRKKVRFYDLGVKCSKVSECTGCPSLLYVCTGCLIC